MCRKKYRKHIIQHNNPLLSNNREIAGIMKNKNVVKKQYY